MQHTSCPIDTTLLCIAMQSIFVDVVLTILGILVPIALFLSIISVNQLESASIPLEFLFLFLIPDLIPVVSLLVSQMVFALHFLFFRFHLTVRPDNPKQKSIQLHHLGQEDCLISLLILPAIFFLVYVTRTLY